MITALCTSTQIRGEGGARCVLSHMCGRGRAHGSDVRKCRQGWGDVAGSAVSSVDLRRRAARSSDLPQPGRRCLELPKRAELSSCVDKCAHTSPNLGAGASSCRNVQSCRHVLTSVRAADPIRGAVGKGGKVCTTWRRGRPSCARVRAGAQGGERWRAGARGCAGGRRCAKSHARSSQDRRRVASRFPGGAGRLAAAVTSRAPGRPRAAAARRGTVGGSAGRTAPGGGLGRSGGRFSGRRRRRRGRGLARGSGPSPGA